MKQVVGLRALPDASTLSRRMADMDEGSVESAHEGNRLLAISGFAEHGLNRYTLNFDGLIQSTRRHAEGSAVGFNRKRKGEPPPKSWTGGVLKK